MTNLTGALIQSIERGERTCEVANLDLLATYERSLRLGTPLNAVVRLLPAPLRRPDGPLHGLAVAVKDIIDIQGVPRGNGNPESMGAAPASADAPLITALREAGADVYATTTLLEYAAGALHPDVAEAMNPYDVTRTAGGSSGGSAALVGVGACDVAIGTDTGGSIRIPAHYCNVVGFKPTYDTFSLAGVTPLSPSLDHVGLIAKDVAVTERVFSALTGQDPFAARTQRLRIGVVNSQLNDPVLKDDVRQSLREAVTLLGEDADIVEIDGGAFDKMRQTFDDIILFEAWQVHGERVQSSPTHYGPDTLRMFLSAATITVEAYESALAERERLLASTDAPYEGVDVILTPAAPFVAPETTPPMDTPDGAIEGQFTSTYNLTGVPAIVIPCGFNSAGLPIGLQLSSPRGTDMALLRDATAVQKILNVEPRRPVLA